MNEKERENILGKLNDALSKPGGMLAIRFILNTAGSIPVVGGAISGVGSLQAEREQQEINRLLLNWASIADEDIKKITEELGKLAKEPTKASFALLIGEIFGDEMATQLLLGNKSSIYVVLNPATLRELEVYITKEWVNLEPTGSTCLMGAGNSVGNEAEDQKKPYGYGEGFILRINKL